MLHPRPSSLARHGLATAALCCAIALALTIAGQGRWDVQLAYSLAIGLVTWLVIEAGRAWLTRRSGATWPDGWRGLLLIAVGIACGYVLGSYIGNAYGGGTLHLLQGQGTALAVTLAAGISGSYFFYSQGKARQLQAHMAQARHDAMQARLKLLETQLEPHMLFNTLANLRALIASDPARAQDMLDHLIAYLRATLGASRATLHPLADEFARLQDYLALMAVRMGPRLQYRLDLPDALGALPVPPLLLQPLVENAIRHGLEPKVEGGSITVHARTMADGATLQLQVCDSGVGLPTGELRTSTPGGGFGLQQVRERLATLYGAAATLELIAVSAGGTSATVTFYLKNYADSPDRRG